jgi:hypothetical protein
MAPRAALGRLQLDFPGNREHFLKRKWCQSSCCWDPLRAEKGKQVQKYRIRDHRQSLSEKVSENDATIVVK